MPSADTSPPQPVEAFPDDELRRFADKWTAAVAEEAQARDFAFLDIPRDICGIKILPMTLRHMLARLLIGCPFFEGKTPMPEDVVSFLWHLSPEFVPEPEASQPIVTGRWLWKKTRPSSKQQFINQVAFLSYAELVKGIYDYIDWTFFDAPASGERTSRVAFTSFAATYLDILGSQYDWSAIGDKPVLDTPLVKIYQLIKAMQKRNNPEAPLFNRRSDKVRADFYAALNARKKSSSSSPEAPKTDLSPPRSNG